MKVRILHIGKYFYPFQGGIENTMLALMRAQKSLGHVVSACVHQHDSSDSNFYRRFEGLSIFVFPVKFTVLFLPIALRALRIMTRVIQTESPDVIHFHLPNATSFWLLLSVRARRIPWVVHWHSDVLGERAYWPIKLFYPVYSIFENWLLARANTIIVTSPNYLNTSRPLKRWRHKCKIIPLCVDLAESEDKQIKQQLSSQTLPFRIICVGRLTYYKGHDFLIDAVEHVNTSGVACYLDIVGKGERLEYLRNRVKSKNIEEKINFHSNLSDQELHQKMCNADVLCLPSIERTEAFGLVLLEAMKAKLPCIVTDVPGSGMSYVVVNERTGLVVKRADAMSLMNAIFRLANSPDLRAAMGEAGRQRVVEHFSIEKVSRATIKIYSDILEGKNAPLSF